MGAGRVLGVLAGAMAAGATTWSLTRRWMQRPPALGGWTASTADVRLGEPDPFGENSGHDPSLSSGPLTDASIGLDGEPTAAAAAGNSSGLGWPGPGTVRHDAGAAEQPGWLRTNFHGETVSLVAGPAVTAGALAGVLVAPGLSGRARFAAAGAAVVIGAVGVYDDLAGDSSSKGLRGHLAALQRGELTSGAVKVGVIGAAGAVSAALVSDNVVDAVVGGAVVAGHANLLNLLDLRPGRAGKAALLHAPLALRGPLAPVGAATLGAVTASLPEDLGERTMLGDGGANVIGGLLGLSIVAGSGRVARLTHLAAVVALTLASEKVSFTQVIENTPVLRDLDHLGRRP